MFQLIRLHDISLSFANKPCFENFSTDIHSENRIAIVGRNGSGKSSLLKIIMGEITPNSGQISKKQALSCGYVEQTIEAHGHLSGGQRFNKRLSHALAQNPNLLLLDEPTNHLDRKNKISLIRMLKHYRGALILVSHDTQLIDQCAEIIWHIEENKVHIFHGKYQDYRDMRQQQRSSIEKKMVSLEHEKKSMHHALMQEQQRASKSKKKGKKSVDQRKWSTVVSHAKAMQASATSGKKKASIDQKKEELMHELASLKQPSIIHPTFSISANTGGSSHLLSVHDASLGSREKDWILKNINFSLQAGERIAICGPNGSGKSTFIKGILAQENLILHGKWHRPKRVDIGYLDQHYKNLEPNTSILDHLQALRTDWDTTKIRRHLSDFLFKKNEAVYKQTKHLSGGEKARASLCLIAAKTPKVLILDEITNNLDLETKAHVIQVLKAYPGALILISHDDDFLSDLNIDVFYKIEKQTLSICHGIPAENQSTS